MTNMKTNTKVLIGAGIAGLAILGITKIVKAGNETPTPEPGLASLSGTVTDSSSGQPINEVYVNLGSMNTYTNSSGFYSFNDIAPDIYQLVFSKDGYETQIV